MSGTATGSGDGRYRYALTRAWSSAGSGITWVMLNPSTATAEQDDPTIRRCIGFSQMWGYGGLTILNLYAYRTTNPKELLEIEDPAGPMNHLNIERIIRDSTLVVAAWGAFAEKVDLRRGRTSVEALCHRARVACRCLGRTQSGAPRHPLYVKGTTKLEPFGLFEEGTVDAD